MKNIIKNIMFISLLLLINNKVIYSQNNRLADSLITVQLHLLFDDSYGVSELVCVNEELGVDLRNRRGYYPIDDPYNTLKDSYIFYANTRDINKDDLVGIYKNGEIIWHSDPIIYGWGAALIGTIDMNLDGNVEIIYAVDIRGSYQGSNDIWIFSWDGNTGNCINAKNSEGYYIPLSMSFRRFSMDDIDGDGILEVRSHQEKDGTLAWSWNGQAYGKWNSTPIVPFEAFQPATNAEANVKCEVTKNDTLFLYEYTISNNGNSRRSIQKFHIEHGLYDKSGSAPIGWKYIGRLGNSPSSWNYNLGNTKNLILPGETVEGFKVKSVGLPKIANFYIQSDRGPWFRNRDSGGGDALIRMHEDIINNSFSNKTITPYSPPFPFIPSDFLDTLNTYTDSSHALDWIETEETKNKYNTYFNNAKTFLEQTDSASARAELELVLNDCNADSSTVLSSEAYALLYFNTEYLIEQLPDSAPEVPTKFDPIAFVDTLLSYNTQCLDNGWLSAAWVHTVLKSSLDNAKLMLQQNQLESSKQIMIGFNVILDSYKTSNFVTTEGYNLLKPNSDFLISKLDSIINAPQNVEASALLDLVFAANETCNTAGWYSATWVYTNFTAMLNNAQITLEQNNPLGCKTIIEGFVIILDSYKTSGFVSEEGYNHVKPKCLDLIEELSN